MSWLFMGLLFAGLVSVPLFVSSVLTSRLLRRPFPDVPIVPCARIDGEPVLVQCTGTLVVRSGHVRAPIRARECAFVLLRVGGTRRQGIELLRLEREPERSWAEVALRDASGEVALVTDGAVLELDADRHVPREFTTNLVGPPPPELDAWMEARGLPRQGPSMGPLAEHVTVSEWVMDAGDPIAVVGRVVEGEGPYRGGAVLRAERVRLLTAKY